MTALREVLAAHRWFDRKRQTCSCGWDYERGNGVPRVDQHDAHVEAAVLAWVAERLASAEVREAVGRAMFDCDVANERIGADESWQDETWQEWLHQDADAALTAVREVLTGRETRSGAPLAGEQGEMAPGDHRDDERLSGPGMGEL